MSREKGRGFWGVSRRVFRWIRIFLLAMVLAGALALVWLNEVGLPDFIKRRVVAGLEKEGLNLRFSRLRLDGYRRLAIDRVRLETTNNAGPVAFNAAKAELKFQREALKAFEFKLESVDLKNGFLELSVVDTNVAGPKLQVENIQAQLRRDGQDHWTLESFEGESMGARWRVSGSLANLAALQRSTGSVKTNAIRTEGLRDFLETIQKFQFDTPPQISVTVLGDFKDLKTFRGSISMRSARAKTPWGDVDDLFMRSVVAPSQKPGEQMEAHVSLNVKRAETPWGGLDNLSLLTDTYYPLTAAARFDSAWRLNADRVAIDWFTGSNVSFNLKTSATEGTNFLTIANATAENGKIIFGEASRANFQARLEHSYPIESLNGFLADFLPVKPADESREGSASELLSLGQHWRGNWQLDFSELRSRHGSAGKLFFDGDVRERPAPIETDRSWGFWRHLAPVLIDWRAQATEFISPEARIDRVAANGQWNAPRITVDAMDSELYGGSFHFNAALDIPTRKVEGATKMDFDVKKTSSLLDPDVRGFFKDFTWEKPPRIAARLSATLPPWTNAPGTTLANARRDVLKSSVLEGSLAVGKAAYRGVTCTEASTHFYLTNFQWRFPNIVLKREEGQLDMSYTGHAFETPFRLEVRGGVDPWAAMPLLNKDAQEGLRFVKFTQPPLIDGVLTGDLQTNSLLRFEGKIASSNVVVRGEPFLDFRTHVVYSNLWIFLTDPIAHRTTNEVVTASWGAVDLRRGVMHLTNGFSTTDPYKFTKVIGPVAYRAVAPYVFKTPPTVRAWGIIPLADEDDADIHFQISGDDLAYWRFNMSKVSGGVYWKGDSLDVTNLQANFYGGELIWEGHFNFLKGGEANYRFKGVSTNVDLTLLLGDLLPGTSNRLEGTLHGTLVVTDANTININTWKGHGEGQLRDGFLWDIPIFGIFSGPLDAIVPGFGKSKITRGAGTFRVEGGKVYTEDMEVRAPAFRLKYDGSVDFDGNLDAMVEAQLLRDTWILGRAMSTLLWPLAKAFESKVTGNLSAPKSELAHIPKAILFPLRPIQTLKELFPKEKEKQPSP